MLERLLQNHVLANLTFALVLVIGFITYFMLPREQDPTINFNWIQITTILQGASAEDVEKLVTDPLEEALNGIGDIRFVSSNSRENVSNILVRFEELNERTFDKRVTDLRREIQSKANAELPADVEEPRIFEITTANAFPSATLVVRGQDFDENLRLQARRIRKEIERISGVDRVDAIGLNDPEYQIHFHAEKLANLGISPTTLSDTVQAYFRDVSAGTVRMGEYEWLVRLVGKAADPEYLANLPVLTGGGEVPLSTVAEISRTQEKADRRVSFNGGPAIMLSVMKQADTNILDLVASVVGFVDRFNELGGVQGVELVLVDDQTLITRNALNIMQTNMLLGLFFVLIVTWVFLGSRIALLTSIGIPFTLAGTFWALSALGQTLNVTVLLGVVISLGMLVDDAVVVVEAIYYRMVRGMDSLKAAREALLEVFSPVTTSVLTTMAAFSPLMLMPGILGQFMMVVPLVVTVALAISLVEAYWMLPSHIHAFGGNFRRPGRVQQARTRIIHRVRVKYTLLLIKVLRWPKATLLAVTLLIAAAMGALAGGLVRFEFFAFDPVRLFYVNVEMAPGTNLDKSLERVRQVEKIIRDHVRPGEVREIAAYTGIMFTEVEPFFGDQYGQILVSLNPKTDELRSVDEMIAGMRDAVTATSGPKRISFLRISGGPPTTRPISIKVRGDDFKSIRAAVKSLYKVLESMPAVHDIVDDDNLGRMELRLTLDTDAVRRAGLHPVTVARVLRLMVDGEVVASMQDEGEQVNIRVMAQPEVFQDIDALLQRSLAIPGGGRVSLGQLVKSDRGPAQGMIRHYGFRRAITLEAELDKLQMNTKQANEQVMAAWEDLRQQHPTIDLDFTGELDDIQESLDSIALLFVFGVGLIYVILGTQFRSYWQPFMILSAVPMAFTGVVLGLIITNNPLSLFTLYGVVALAGIAVNSAIVLISAANARLRAGMSVLHATLYAARRRVIPVLITSFTTIAGLFSLATGLGGHSLLWGPVATAIVWGLSFSTVLTLLMIPLLYRLFMPWGVRRSKRRRERALAEIG